MYAIISFVYEVIYSVILFSCQQEKKDLGELMLSLCYLPTAGRLTVTVIKGRNLKAMDINGSSGKLNGMFYCHAVESPV